MNSMTGLKRLCAVDAFPFPLFSVWAESMEETSRRGRGVHGFEEKEIGDKWYREEDNGRRRLGKQALRSERQFPARGGTPYRVLKRR